MQTSLTAPPVNDFARAGTPPPGLCCSCQKLHPGLPGMVCWRRPVCFFLIDPSFSSMLGIVHRLSRMSWPSLERPIRGPITVTDASRSAAAPSLQSMTFYIAIQSLGIFQVYPENLLQLPCASRSSGLVVYFLPTTVAESARFRLSEAIPCRGTFGKLSGLTGRC